MFKSAASHSVRRSLGHHLFGKVNQTTSCTRFYASAKSAIARENIIAIKDMDHFEKHIKETTKPFLLDGKYYAVLWSD